MNGRIIGNGFNSDYFTDIARGVYPDKSLFHAFGEKTTTSGGNGLLWPNGAFTVEPSVAQTIEVVSDSVQDAAGGTGISSIEVHYIDTNWNEQFIDVPVTGLTPNIISAPTQIRFIQCVHLVTVGASESAVGNITLRVAGGGATYSYIAAGEVRCTSSARMVPAGKRLLIYSAIGGAVSGTAAAQVKIRIAGTKIYSHEYLSPVIFVPYASLGFQDNSDGHRFNPPLVVPEKNIIAMTYNTDKAATITGSWFGILE